MNAGNLEIATILRFYPTTTSQPDLDDAAQDASKLLVSALLLSKVIYVSEGTYCRRSSAASSSLVRRRSTSSRICIRSSSMESFTSERCFDWLRDERHASPMMSAVATLNKKPSARKFAPFSMALSAERSMSVVPQPGEGIQSSPGLREWANMLGRFAQQARSQPHFVAVHGLCERYTHLSEAFVSFVLVSACCIHRQVVSTYSLAWLLMRVLIGLARVLRDFN